MKIDQGPCPLPPPPPPPPKKKNTVLSFDFIRLEVRHTLFKVVVVSN